jgi:hypothetical protein
MIYRGKQRGEFFLVRSNLLLRRLCFHPFPFGLRPTWESFSSRHGATRPCRANEALGSRPEHGWGCDPATFHICWNIFCNPEAVSSSRWWQQLLSKWLSAMTARVSWNVVAKLNFQQHSCANLRSSLNGTLSVSLLVSEYTSKSVICLDSCKPSVSARVKPWVLNSPASKLVTYRNYRIWFSAPEFSLFL